MAKNTPNGSKQSETNMKTMSFLDFWGKKENLCKISLKNN